MGDSWGMNPTPLYNAGGNISNLRPEAQSATNGFLGAVTDAGSVVHHSVLRNALSEFHGRWSVPANRLAHNVDAAGSGVQKGAVVGADGDHEASADLSPAETAATTQYEGLSRPINA